MQTVSSQIEILSIFMCLHVLPSYRQIFNIYFYCSHPCYFSDNKGDGYLLQSMHHILLYFTTKID